MSEAPVHTVTRILRSHRFRYQDEADLQRGIAEALAEYGPEREVRLSADDRIDFVLWRVGIEVKIKGGISPLTRQLLRYAQSPDVDALVLVTSRRQYALQLPRVLNGKPLHVVDVGMGFA